MEVRFVLAAVRVVSAANQSLAVESRSQAKRFAEVVVYPNVVSS